MKKSLCLAFSLLLCLSMTCTVFASGDIFVPSIGYKDGPEIEDAEMNGEEVGACLIVTSVNDAKEMATDIPQEDRDQLLDIHKALENGTMKLPIDNEKYVVRELVDVSYKEADCVESEHGHEEWLEQEQTTVTATFDLGVTADTEVIVLVYVDEQWIPAQKVINNGDGTVTVIFEDIGPVAFCVPANASELPDEPAQTGDAQGQNLMLWIVLMAGSSLGIFFLLILRKKTAREGR